MNEIKQQIPKSVTEYTINDFINKKINTVAIIGHSDRLPTINMYNDMKKKH